MNTQFPMSNAGHAIKAQPDVHWMLDVEPSVLDVFHSNRRLGWLKIMPGRRLTLQFATVVFTALLVALGAFAAPPNGYYLVWSDEFNSTSLDTSKWNYWMLGRRRDALDVTNAVSVNGSNLVIRTYTSNNVHYTAMIATDGTFRPRYGYWEASIKWGDTNGMWSAFWFQSPTMSAVRNGPEAAGSEIDIAEHRYADGSDNNIAGRVQVNIHWSGYGAAAKHAGSGYVGSGLESAFHTYGFLWTPDSYSFRIDGAQVYDGGPSPVSHSAEWAILSSEVDDTSTTWAGRIPPGGYGSLAGSTTRLTVDYVRYYAPANTIFWTGGSSIYLTNPANWIAGKTPASASDCTFSYLSGNNLTLAPGRDLRVHGLVFLNTKIAASLDGAAMLTLGGGGVDMLAANRAVNINCPVNIGANQTWTIGPNPGSTLNINAPISGAAALSKSGRGAVILNGANAFSGTITNWDGNFIVNGSLAGPVTVAGGTLGGSGSIAGAVTIQSGATLSPGNSAGTLTFGNSLTLAAGSKSYFEINESLQTNDAINVAGALACGGTLTVANLGENLAAGDSFKLFNAGSCSGNFSALKLPPAGAGLAWDTNGLTNGVLSVVAVAP